MLLQVLASPGPAGAGGRGPPPGLRQAPRGMLQGKCGQKRATFSQNRKLIPKLGQENLPYRGAGRGGNLFI